MPVIFTSARDQDIDRIMGLELGSDDYISKPFSIRELMLRVKNLLNRVYAQNSNNENIVQYGDYRLDFDKRVVTLNDVNLNLTAKEYDLLLFLVKIKERLFLVTKSLMRYGVVSILVQTALLMT